MTRKNSRAKGARGEREFAAFLRQHGFDARRGQQFAGGADSPDIVCASLSWLHIEVKRVEHFNVAKACAQAARDAARGAPAGHTKPWIVAHRRNRQPWSITMDADTGYRFLVWGDSPSLALSQAANPRPLTVEADLFLEFLRRHVADGDQPQQHSQSTLMKIKSNSGNFQPCPEFTGQAVCVDVTPLKTVQTQFGPKEKFRFVFEIAETKDDGAPWCVWSAPFTPSYHENAALRPFLRKWMGRELTAEELKSFDTEDLIGRTAHITVIHEHSDGEVYANIALIQPDKSAEPLVPSGKYVRQKDRQAGPGPNGAGAQGGGGGYRRVEQPASATPDHASVKVHVGKYAGHELRDLSLDAVKALVEKWLPAGKALPKPTADDKRLIAALEWWVSTQEKANDDLEF